MKYITHWPTGSRNITQKFGANKELYKEKFGLLNGHNGLDIGSYEGEAIYAAADGEVIGVGFDENGYGNWVLVGHGTEPLVSTLYAHLNKAIVKEYQKVKGGEQIAISGNTGFSTGPHLHFGVRIDQKPVDPLPHLGALEPEIEGVDGWLWRPGMAIHIGSPASVPLNLRKEPAITSALLDVVPLGQRFEVLGPERNGYLPVRIIKNEG